MSGVSKEMIFDAANQLLAAGQSATVAAVREKIGKGSYAAYIEPMREWRGGQKSIEAPAREMAPQTIRDRLQALGDDIWEAAVALASDSLKHEREALDEVRVGMEEELREAVTFADQIVNDAEQLRLKNEELKALLDAERAAHGKMKSSHQEEMNQRIRLTAELESVKTRYEDLKEENRNSRSMLEQATIDRERLMENDKKQTSDIVKLQGKLEEAKNNHERDLERNASNLKNVEEERERALLENKKMKSEAIAETIRMAKMEGEIATLNKQLEQLERLLEKLTPSPASAENKKE